MINIYINNFKIVLKKTTTILKACEYLNYTIPKFCYHDKLNVAGNCRMCLVEIENSIKPIVACANPVNNNMKIYTDSPLVQKARENILEFILINHPLDCPICDQAGICDLQDQVLFYGVNYNRFYELKNSKDDGYLNPLIKTIMTRCITCTKCIRFLNEITGNYNLGNINRGNKSSISLYFNKNLLNEYSGNIIDLCPVGALTAKSYAFSHRSWELKKIKNYDIFDSLGSDIFMYYIRNEKIVKILPKFNDLKNEFWISDKTRFAYDGFKNLQKRPLILYDNKYKRIKWKKILKNIQFLFCLYKESNIILFTGDFIDLQSIIFIKKLIKKKNINFFYKNQYVYDNIEKCNYTFNINILKNYKVLLLLGIQLYKEASFLNIKIRKLVLQGKLFVLNFGLFNNIYYPYLNLGNNIKLFYNMLKGKSKFYLYNKKNIILYNSSFKKINLLKHKNNLNCFYISSNIEETGIMHYNLKNLNNINYKNINNSKIIYNFNYNFFKNKINFISKKKIWYIYQGYFNKNIIKGKYDYILPISNYMRTYLEFLTLENKKIINNIQLASRNPSLELLKKNFKFFFDINYNTDIDSNFNNNLNIKNIKNIKSKINNNIFLKSKFKTFFNTNIITNYSKLMFNCQKFESRNKTNFKLNN